MIFTVGQCDVSPLVNLIFNALFKAKYEADDIFRVIYQDMVSPGTRHAFGEFYTPIELAQLMVDDSYNYGQMVLDPACGSGTFLIEIISRIRSSTNNKQDLLKAINNLYGFDVNPIAVLVAKANILLHCEDILKDGIQINIFLTDSLFPIEKILQKDADLGEYELFVLGDRQESTGTNKQKIIKGSIGEIKIAKLFFTSTSPNGINIQEQFISFLRYLDLLITNETQWNKIQDDFKTKFPKTYYSWLYENIPNTLMGKTYLTNLFDIGKNVTI